MFSFIHVIDSLDSKVNVKQYFRRLTNVGWATSSLNIFFAFCTIVLYSKYSKEMFIGNHFFFVGFRIPKHKNSLVENNSEIERKIHAAQHLITKPHSFHFPNDAGYIAQLSNVNKYFKVNDGIFHALKNVNLDIEEGDFVVILGYSGSGKTTLLNILAGIDRPTDGKCVISDCDITKMSDYDLNLFRRKKIGYIFQNYALLPNLTASENIELVCGMNSPMFKEIMKKGFKDIKSASKLSEKILIIGRLFKNMFVFSDTKEDVNNLLEILNLTEHRDKYPNMLSGGQQQRVSIARALAKKPKILLADEPTGAIDHAMTKSILNLFYEINTYMKTTVILITHNPLIAKMAKRVLYVAGGEIVSDKRNLHPQHPNDIKDL